MTGPGGNGPGSGQGSGRSRLIGALLTLILLACVAVIVLDQMGVFGGAAPATTPVPGTTELQPDPLPTDPLPGQPSTGDGYDDLK